MSGRLAGRTAIVTGASRGIGLPGGAVLGAGGAPGADARARRGDRQRVLGGGTRPAPGIGFYGASKAMLTHLTQELAVELGPDVRVNAVAPAVVKTAFATALYEGREEQVAATYPLKRLGVPTDVASVVAFLLSADAAWMTGQLLLVDGGVTLTGAG